MQIHPRVRTALTFLVIGAIVGGWIGSRPDNTLGLVGGALLGGGVFGFCGLLWD